MSDSRTDEQRIVIDTSMHSCGRERWLILSLSCVGMIGSYYCYDIPAALSKELSEFMHLNSVQYNMLYTVYSLPNTILPLFGGWLIDRIGCNYCLLLFASFILVGQFLFALGVSSQSFVLALVGRTVFGFGGESLSVASSTLLAIWFRNREIALAMGLNLTISRLGSVANNNMSAWAYQQSGVAYAAWIGLVMTFISLASFSCMIVVDYVSKKRALKHNPLLHTDCENNDEKTEENNSVHINDALHFSKSFWLIVLSCVTVYSTILPFNNIAEALLEERYHLKTSRADFYLSIPYTLSAVASPLLGGVVDLLGGRAILLTMSAASLAFAHAIFAFTLFNPVFSLIIIGISYSIYASAMWPSVALVVDSRHLGSAYGVATAIQNAGLALVPILIGGVHDMTHSYASSEVYVFALAMLGVVIGIILNFIDHHYNDDTLNTPTRRMKTSMADSINVVDEISSIDDVERMLTNPLLSESR